MAGKALKAPGVKGKGGNDRRAAGTLRSPLAPTSTGNAPMDDVRTAEVRKGTLRSKQQGVGGSDAALGMTSRRAPRQTTAGAQFRISMKLPGAQVPQAQSTLANGRTVPAVMGAKQRQNFDLQRGVLY